jgi:hypothetical protein
MPTCSMRIQTAPHNALEFQQWPARPQLPQDLTWCRAPRRQLRPMYAIFDTTITRAIYEPSAPIRPSPQEPAQSLIRGHAPR